MSKVKGKLAGGVAGDPLLVRGRADGEPEYYIVPAQRDGRTVGLIGVSADGAAWQWYNDAYKHSQFPPVARGQARRALGGAEPVLVAGEDKKLYWSAGDGRLVNADNARDVKTARQVIEDAASGDVQMGTGATGEASDTSGSMTVTRTAALPTAKSLALPHYYQNTSYFCGPASLQMLFDYYNPAIQSQAEIAQVMNAKDWGEWKGAYATDLLRTARFSYLSTAVQNQSLQGWKERQLGYGAVSNFWSSGGTSDPDYATRYEDLKSLIAGGYPVLVLTWYDGTHRTGHFRVVKGYDDATGELLVHDPWYTSPYYGPDVHFRQSFFVDDLWARNNRWAVIAAPWKVAVSAPSTVSAGTPFTVSATVRYLGPHPFEGRGDVSGSQATISVPDGMTVSDPVKELPNITRSGTYQTVSWTVTPSSGYTGSPRISVTAQGRITNSSPSYSTYTDAIGGTGSRTVTVGAGGSAASISSLSPVSISSVPGEFRTLTATYSDPDGASDVRSSMLLVNTETSGARALYAVYSSATNRLYLRNADNTAWLDPAQPGSSAVLDNGYARVDAGRTTVARSGDDLIIKWTVSESALSSGRLHNVYLQAEDNGGNITGWRKMGSWLVNRAAVAGQVPQAGSTVAPGVPVTITGGYSDADGVGNLQTAQLLINKQLAGAGSVWLRYDAAQKRLYLRNGDNTGWLGPIAPGSTSTLSNGRAVLSGASTRVSATDTGLTIRWGVTFSKAFSGERYNLYSVAADKFTSQSALPWVTKGSYAVSARPAVLAYSTTSATSAPGKTAAHALIYTDPDSTADLGRLSLLVNTSTSGTRAAYAMYDRSQNKLYLRNDANTGWLGGISPGSTATVSNTAVTLRAATTTISHTSTGLKVAWSLAYKPAYSGKTYRIYGLAEDRQGVRSDWTQVGRWTVNRAPNVVSVSPRDSYSRAGSWVAFSTTYKDADSAANIAEVRYIVNSTASGSRGLLLRYHAATNKLWMRNPDGDGWLGGIAPGTGTQISSTYARLDASRTTVTRDGNYLVVRWVVSLSSQMKGRSLKQYLFVRDLTGAQTGNVAKGSWSVR